MNKWIEIFTISRNIYHLKQNQEYDCFWKKHRTVIQTVQTTKTEHLRIHSAALYHILTRKAKKNHRTNVESYIIHVRQLSFGLWLCFSWSEIPSRCSPGRDGSTLEVPRPSPRLKKQEQDSTRPKLRHIYPLQDFQILISEILDRKREGHKRTGGSWLVLCFERERKLKTASPNLNFLGGSWMALKAK